MPVTVRLFAILREQRGEERLDLEYRPGETIEELLDRVFPSPPAGLWPPQLLYAINQSWASGETVLQDGDEVAFIPPLGGGSGDDPRVSLGEDPLDLGALVTLVAGPGRGGIATFSGTVRDHFEGRAVLQLSYEAYPEMALTEMSRLCDVVETRWPGVAIAMAHRLGCLDLGESAVCIAAGAPHRAEAFDACRFAIDELKRRIPIFKKEIYTDGSSWKANP